MNSHHKYTAQQPESNNSITSFEKSFCLDLQWCYAFTTWNGLSFLCLAQHSPNFDYQTQTDTSGSWRLGSWGLKPLAYFPSQWFQLP